MLAPSKPVLSLTAADVMSQEVVALPQSLPLRAAARVLSDYHISGAPVVDAQGVARLRLITTGERRAGRVEALSGLAAGERIVVDATDRVRDGARVAATP